MVERLRTASCQRQVARHHYQLIKMKKEEKKIIL